MMTRPTTGRPSVLRTGAPARTGALLLLLGPLISWLAEFITASAWQDPPYAPLYNWISHLGLPEAETAFGQYANSPLAWVMNTGWVLYGTLLIVGAFLLFDLRRGWLPRVLVLLAIVSGVGVSLLAIFHGSNENVANGTAVFHFLGAQGALITGNAFAIFAGIYGARLSLSPGWSRTLIVVGGIGLVSFIVFMVDVRSGNAWNLGLFERGATYAVMASHLIVGSLSFRRLRAAATRLTQ